MGSGKDVGEIVTDFFIFGLFTNLKFLEQRRGAEAASCFHAFGNPAEAGVL
jgi:hypothetical protein